MQVNQNISKFLLPSLVLLELFFYLKRKMELLRHKQNYVKVARKNENRIQAKSIRSSKAMSSYKDIGVNICRTNYSQSRISTCAILFTSFYKHQLNGLLYLLMSLKICVYEQSKCGLLKIKFNTVFSWNET